MLDTVRLESPPLDDWTAGQVEAMAEVTRKVDMSTGALLRELVNCPLEGSWDCRRSAMVRRERFTRDATLSYIEAGKGTQYSVPVRVKCRPYLVLEGSVHKALLGHNLHGGPLEVQEALGWFVQDTQELLSEKLGTGVELPASEDWEIRRIDWAEAYDLGCFEGVQEYMHALRLASYPRRGGVDTWGDESVMAVGATSAVRVYHKGPEFSVHDFKRIRGQFGLERAEHLQGVANGLLRIEVELQARKLTADHSGKALVPCMTREYLERQHDQETLRLLGEAQDEMDTVRSNRAVRNRLYEVYNGELASRLFGTWLQFAALGIDVARANMKRRTFYRHRKLLLEAGCSWIGGDVVERPSVSAIPAGFAPVRGDPRRLTQQAPEVTEAIAPFRRVA